MLILLGGEGDWRRGALRTRHRRSQIRLKRMPCKGSPGFALRPPGEPRRGPPASHGFCTAAERLAQVGGHRASETGLTRKTPHTAGGCAQAPRRAGLWPLRSRCPPSTPAPSARGGSPAAARPRQPRPAAPQGPGAPEGRAAGRGAAAGASEASPSPRGAGEQLGAVKKVGAHDGRAELGRLQKASEELAGGCVISLPKQNISGREISPGATHGGGGHPRGSRRALSLGLPPAPAARGRFPRGLRPPPGPAAPPAGSRFARTEGTGKDRG